MLPFDSGTYALDEEGLHDDTRRLRGNNKKKENPCVVF